MNIDPPDSIVLSGGFIMELCFDVKRAEMVIGKVRVEKQGLYCKIKCKCVLDTSEVCKLHLSCFGADRNLGVLIPDAILLLGFPQMRKEIMQVGFVQKIMKMFTKERA